MPFIISLSRYPLVKEVVSLMSWLIWTSFKRNWFRYWLAIVGLAAAVAVACVGISGAALMWQMSKYPLLQVVGGELMVLDERVEFFGSSGSVRSSNMFENMSFSMVRESIENALPGSQTTGTLIVMSMQHRGTQSTVRPIYGREDDTGIWIYGPTIMEGEPLKDVDYIAMEMLLPAPRFGSASSDQGPGAVRPVLLAVFDEDSTPSWDLAGGTRVNFTVVGTYKQPAHGEAIVALSTLQALSGAHDKVTYIGVALENPLMIEQGKQDLAAALAETHPELQVLSVNDLGDLMIADFAQLEQTSSFYTPVMILVSVIVVVVTALAMRQARKRELVLLRTIGLSASQVRSLFIVECTAVAVLGALVGVGLAIMLSSMLFSAYTINVLPAIAAILVTFVVSVLMSGGAKGRAFTEMLRNP